MQKKYNLRTPNELTPYKILWELTHLSSQTFNLYMNNNNSISNHIYKSYETKTKNKNLKNFVTKKEKKTNIFIIRK